MSEANVDLGKLLAEATFLPAHEFELAAAEGWPGVYRRRKLWSWRAGAAVLWALPCEAIRHPNYPGYTAGVDGKCYRELLLVNGRPVLWAEVSASTNGSGYHAIKLHRSGKDETGLLAAFIATAYLGPRPDGLTIDHVDMDKLNNKPGNLEYVTLQENTTRACRGGRRLGRQKRNGPVEVIAPGGGPGRVYRTLRSAAEAIGGSWLPLARALDRGNGSGTYTPQSSGITYTVKRFCPTAAPRPASRGSTSAGLDRRPKAVEVMVAGEDSGRTFHSMGQAAKAVRGKPHSISQALSSGGGDCLYTPQGSTTTYRIKRVRPETGARASE